MRDVWFGGELDVAASSEVSFTLLLPALCGRGDLFCLLGDSVGNVRLMLQLR